MYTVSTQSQKRTINSLELELTDGYELPYRSGNESGSAARAASAFNCRAISPLH